jgi:hypothetical protein
MFKKRGQVGLEFVLVTMVAFFTLIVFALVLHTIMVDKQEEKVYLMAEDLAISLKHELSFASGAEVGYARILHFPKSIEGVNYEVVLGSTSINTGYFELKIRDAVFFEMIPLTNGIIEPGTLRITKRVNDVFVEVIS